MIFYSTKTYEHLGSAAFRQWRAESHCRFLHGYSPTIRIVFASDELDIRHWVVDFGSLKGFKIWLENTFDHKTLVAQDDPHIEWFKQGARLGVIDIVYTEANGCEEFAKLIFDCAEIWMVDNGYSPRVWVESVEYAEHGGNSAIYRKTPKISSPIRSYHQDDDEADEYFRSVKEDGGFDVRQE